MEEQKVKVNTPSHWILDDKDPAYYKNIFLNNSKMRVKTSENIYNRINSAYNLIEQMIELDSKRDPEIESVAKELIDLKKDIEHIKDYAEKLYEKTREENVYLLSKDFEKYINEKKQEIKKELENEKK
jgi:predicted transcriptional regulator